MLYKKHLIWLIALLSTFVASHALADDGLNLAALFTEPGAKLVVVEFYADWCKPCKAAAPKWNELHKQYAAKGLRFVVVSVNEKGLCSNPGWSPDKIACDLDGSLQKEWQVEQLPMAFLLSWQGKRLVDHGHLDQVKEAIEAYFKDAPRLSLSPLTDGNEQPLEDVNGLRERVRVILAKQAKFDIVASGSEMAAIRRLRAESFAPAKADEQHCELGHEISANTDLRIKLLGAGSNQTLSLQAYSAERGCLVASGAARLTSLGLDKAVKAAVDELLLDFMGRKELKNEADKEKAEGIVVQPLERKEGVSAGLLESLSGLLTADVERFSGQKVISEKDIRTALETQERLSRCTGDAETPTCILAWRELLGASLVVSGDLGRIGDYWVLNLRLINSKGREAEVLGRVGRRVKGDQSALLEALSGAVAELFGVRAETQAAAPPAAVPPPAAPPVAAPKESRPAYGMNPYKKMGLCLLLHRAGVERFRRDRPVASQGGGQG